MKRNLILTIIGIFILLSLPTAAAYRFVVISDTHLVSANINPAIEKIIELKPEFVIHTGDMIMADTLKDTPHPEQWNQVKTEILNPLQSAGISFFYPVKGNHDAGYDSIFPERLTYSFLWNSDKFIILDSSGPSKMDNAQLSLVKSLLLSGQNSGNRFVFSHLPLVNLCQEDKQCPASLNPNLINVLKEGKATIFFNGHQHFFEKVKYNGINLVTSGYLAHYEYTPTSTGKKQPPSFVVVDVNGPNQVQVSAYQKSSSGEFEYVPDNIILAGHDLSKLGPEFSQFSLDGTTGAAASTPPSKGAAVSQSLKILHIGDSHTAGYYGQELENSFESAGHEVTTYGCVGAVAEDYITGGKECTLGSTIKGKTKDYNLPDINEIMQENDEANVVIISLGTNYHTDGGVYNDQKSIQALSEMIKNSNKGCYWVGTPRESSSSINPAGINDALIDILKDSCNVIDSIALTDENKLDKGGIHYTAEGGKEWAQNVYALIATEMGLLSTGEAIEDDAEEKSTVEEDSAEESTDSPSQPSDSQLCEIDSVWITAGTNLNIPNAVKSLVFTLTGWQPFDKVCKPQSKTTPSGKGVTLPANMAEIEKYIQEAGKEFDVDPALIKTVMRYESKFNQSARSNTGCRGLMQVCKWANYNGIVSKYNLNDDVYDAKSNIYVGTYILKEKEKSIIGTCGVACQVAAYNIGQCVIKAAAANAVDKSSWDSVYGEITPQIMDDCSPKGYAKWSTAKKEKKIKDLKNYVNKIMTAYNS